MGSIFFQPCDSFLVWVTILVALAAGYNSISRHDLVKKIDPRRSGTAVMTCFKHLCGNVITLRKYIFLLSGLAIPRDKKAVLTVGYAVCETEQGEKKDIPLSETKDVHEGDVLILKDGVYIPDKDKTEARRKRILALQEDLWD